MGACRHDLPNSNGSLWVDSETVWIERSYKDSPDVSRGEQIIIPMDLIEMIVAEKIRMKKINELESMSDKEILGLKHNA